jgi:hypothetical protein
VKAYGLMLVCAALAACVPVRGHGGVEVVSLQRQVDTTRAGAGMCSDLTLSRADVARYFALAEVVDAATFDAEAIIMPCSYRGSLRRGGKLYQWEIFAGGAAYLYDGAATNQRYLCRESCLAALPNLR